MKLLKMLKSLLGKTSTSDTSEPRSIVIMQRGVHLFSEEELQTAAERGWSKKFNGKEDPMFFVSASAPLTVMKAGPYVIRVTSVPGRYAKDDEYALAHLPKPEQKKAWNEHHACTLLELFNDLESRQISDADAYSALARLAMQLGDPNCAAIYLPMRNIMMPNDGNAEQGLRLLINKELP